MIHIIFRSRSGVSARKPYERRFAIEAAIGAPRGARKYGVATSGPYPRRSRATVGLEGRARPWVGIGAHIRDVQKIFRPVFAMDDLKTDGSDFDRLFEDGDRFAIGELEAEVLHVPGHTPADVAYLIGDAAFVGDTLFMGAVGPCPPRPPANTPDNGCR